MENFPVVKVDHKYAFSHPKAPKTSRVYTI